MRANLKKIPLSMKVFIMLIFCSMIWANAATYSQDITLNLTKKSYSVSELLKVIEKQSGVNFFFNNKQIDITRNVKIDVENKKLFDLLDEIFEGTNVTYSVMNKRIILSLKEKDEVQSTKQTGNYHITGVVVDELGEPIIGASVVEKGTTNGIITDFDGNFKLTVSSDKALIEIS